MKILFQGDSITDGNWGRNGDPNHVMGHGFAFSIASRLGAEYPLKFEFFNRGNSGDDTARLLSRWKTDAVDLNPDLTGILIGTNDLSHGILPEQYEAVYRMLLHDLPDSDFVLCEPFRFRKNETDEEWRALSTRLDEYKKIVRKLAEETHSAFVPLQSVFDAALKLAPVPYWIWDGVHPTVAGHELITRAWLQAASPFLDRERK